MPADTGNKSSGGEEGVGDSVRLSYVSKTLARIGGMPACRWVAVGRSGRVGVPHRSGSEARRGTAVLDRRATSTYDVDAGTTGAPRSISSFSPDQASRGAG